MHGDLRWEGFSFLPGYLYAASSTASLDISPEISPALWPPHCPKSHHEIEFFPVLWTASVTKHCGRLLTFESKRPFHLSREAEFLVAERNEAALLHKPQDLQKVGREGPRPPGIPFKVSVVACSSKQAFFWSNSAPLHSSFNTPHPTPGHVVFNGANSPWPHPAQSSRSRSTTSLVHQSNLSS